MTNNQKVLYVIESEIAMNNRLKKHYEENNQIDIANYYKHENMGLARAIRLFNDPELTNRMYEAYKK